MIQQLKKNGNYIGPHSDAHLLYCDWTKRDSLLVSKKQFQSDLEKNYEATKLFGVDRSTAHYFLPPYEWYNDSIAAWTKEMGLELINYTPGTLSHADYTIDEEKNFRSSEIIFQSIVDYEKTHSSGLNGFILLMHVGAGEKRTDKFYRRLPQLIDWLRKKNYVLVRLMNC